MIKILDHTKSLDLLVDDTTNGLGQFEANSCIITEELNGIYEAVIEMLATDKHFDKLIVGGLLQLEVNEAKDKQIFRIYFISKPINEVVQIKAQHITYDLNKIPVKPFTATGAVNAKNQMLSNVIGTYPFTMTTDISNTTSVFRLDIPRSFRECLGGYEGSLLDVFRGEYEWDNLTVKMLAHRGTDNGVRISYGKNLTDFTQEENIENVYTSVLGYATINDTTYTGNVYHKVQSTYPKVLIVDFSSDYDENNLPTTANLTQRAQDYATNNDIEIPNVNLSISFVPLYQTEEYKNVAPLERVSLGDTVHVYFDKLGVEANSRVVKTVWDANLGRYDSVELGKTKANLNTVLNDVQSETSKEVANSKGFLEDELNQMASLIINGLGLHKTLVETAGGGYRMYLHNKETLEESDTQYIFTSEGFLVSTDYGQTWNAGFDSEGNAIVNSLSTIVLRALEIYGSYIEGAQLLFGNPDGQNVLVSEYNDISTDEPIGIKFSGNGNFLLESLDQTKTYTTGRQQIRRVHNVLDDTYINNIILQTFRKITGGSTAGSTLMLSTLEDSDSKGSASLSVYGKYNNNVYTAGNLSISNSITGSNTVQNNATLKQNYVGDASTESNVIDLITQQSGFNTITISCNDSSGNVVSQIYLSNSSTLGLRITAPSVVINGKTLVFNSDNTVGWQ